MSGIWEQALALVNFAAARPELKNAPAAIVYIDDQLNTAGANAAEERAIKLGWRGVTKSAERLNDFQAVNLVQDFKQKKTQTVFFFGAAGSLKQLMQACEASNITPTFLRLQSTRHLHKGLAHRRPRRVHDHLRSHYLRKVSDLPKFGAIRIGAMPHPLRKGSAFPTNI